MPFLDVGGVAELGEPFEQADDHVVSVVHWNAGNLKKLRFQCHLQGPEGFTAHSR